ncbi:MAG: hypothetical protein ACEY3M_09550 [Wolbachia sp.]
MLVGSRDTANESRYDGSRRHDVEPALAILLHSPIQCPIWIQVVRALG